MSIAGKVTSFGIILSKLTPYMNRMKPYYELRIEYRCVAVCKDRVEVTWYRYKDGSVSDLNNAIYWFDLNVVEFTDSIIDKLKDYIN